MFVKIANITILMIIFIYSYSYNFPNMITFSMFPTLNIWALLMMKLIIEFIVFKNYYKNLDKSNLFWIISSANIASASVGIIVSSFVYVALFMVTWRVGAYVYIREIACASIALLCSFFIGAYIDSKIIISSNIIKEKPEKIKTMICYANIYSYIIIELMLIYNICMLVKHFLDHSNQYIKTY